MIVIGDTLFAIGFVMLALVGAAFFVFASKPKKKKPDKKKDKAMKELKELKDLAKIPEDAKKPDAVMPPLLPSIMQQYPIHRTIQIELTRLKEPMKRAIWRKGSVTLIPRLGGAKEMFFFYIGKRGYFIDPAKIITVQTLAGRRNKKTVTSEKLVYDIFNSEPLNSDGSIDFSWEVERLLVDSGADQYITVATFESGFQLTPGLMKAIFVVGLFGIFIGLALNGSAGITPRTIIHWVP